MDSLYVTIHDELYIGQNWMELMGFIKFRKFNSFYNGFIISYNSYVLALLFRRSFWGFS